MSGLRLHALLALAAITGLALAGLVGTAPISLSETLAGLLGGASEPVRLIVWEIRIPRALTAFLVGAALGASGAALQGLLRNPLADPGVLGVSAMAALGAVIAIWFGFASLHPLVTPSAAIAGAGLSVVLLYALGAGRVGVTQLILVGVGLSSFAGALTALAMNLAPNPFSLSDLVSWLLGSVANRSWLDIGFAAPFWVVGAVLVLLAAPGLRALSLGEEAAFTLGADLRRARLFAVLGAALLTGAAVAVAGVIGFVGIVAPHLMRPFVRHDPGALIAPSAVAAGIMLVLADIAVRLLPFSQELKIGVAAALVGAPAFVWIAATTRGFGR